MKTSALDYLIEFVNNERNDLWLKGVVALYINSNEVINEADYATMVDELLAEKPKDSKLNGKMAAKSDEKNIRLKSLCHKSGINALAKNQKIVFSDDMTVLYGLNGSGKSSYFRMLQGMIGSIRPEQIIPNIYVEKPDVIKGSIDYSVDKSNITKVEWYNSKPIDDMASIRMFDSTYSQAFLSKRESDGQIINPYKLYVFAQIIDTIDKVKELANERIEKEEEKIVFPNVEAFDDTTKELLDKPQISPDTISQLETVAMSFDSKKADELSNVELELKLLSETNYADKKKLIETEYNQAKVLKKRIDDSLVLWINRINRYCKKRTDYSRLKEESENNRKKIEALKSLPGIKSKEWKDFIQKGLAISTENEELSDYCPYCHQKYNEKSLEIVKAYSLFINNQAEENLSNLKTELRAIIEQAKVASLNFDDFKIERMKEDTDTEDSIELLVNEINNRIKLLSDAEDEFLQIENIEDTTSPIVEKVDSIISGCEAEINETKELAAKKDERIEDLSERKARLLSEKSISEQIDTIKKFCEDKNHINVLRGRVNAASSNRITRLSNMAHSELLTEQLASEFYSNLKSFGIVDKEIELKGRNSKGKQQTELVMKSGNSVTQILSEGEQKAASLALFLAEISVSHNKSAIILDDPVNSLDHRMMDILVESLLKLENQIIVFTHNRMFLDAFSGSAYGHKCKNYNKNGCNKKGKHIFVYDVKSEGSTQKGVVVSKPDDSAKSYLDEARRLLNQTPFTEELKVCAILRNAIDRIIDEKVFNKQIPRKYSMRGIESSINWDDLKKMAADPCEIDTLKQVFGRVSSGELHLGQVSINNPPDKTELVSICSELERILQ